MITALIFSALHTATKPLTIQGIKRNNDISKGVNQTTKGLTEPYEYAMMAEKLSH
jgi:hypothetical protein